ncbi:glycosyltransferase family 4 protein [Marinobacterium weihaiense]|uniref:Glycosyltransferase family 4 protein n=1 Tax=Marinobacterium weihaiense TaxID=2851016 RepID=A0ABS6M8T8_9GAMM|nr:glycosyltransferase family 1 protein [Marinobacterium weihaiense]MBV0932306.1 glycosyltransferase family 4 protein [Marinobacterium weihaiense]
MKTIFIDCSYLADHPELNTGIQRVVRKTVANFKTLAPGEWDIQLVKISNGQFSLLQESDLYPKAELPAAQAGQSLPFKVRLSNYLRGVYQAGREFVSAVCGHHKGVRHFLYAPKNQLGLGMFVHWLLLKPARAAVRLVRRPAAQPSSSDIDRVQRGDVLLLLDSTWYSNIWPSVEAAKAQGASVTAVIYDLIPITHSQFCDDFLAKVFKGWFHDSVAYVDRYIGISQTVQRDLESFMNRELGTQALRDKQFDYFLLGGDIAERTVTATVDMRPELQRAFDGGSCYLIVSTVEPRKNHVFLLDTFENLWRDSAQDVRLIIVGRPGWKVDALLERIRCHPELGRRLYYFSDLDDREVGYSYDNAKALVFPSIVEGFGLPILESLNRGLPVLASDTPVHREVGGEQVGYFSLDDHKSLLRWIETFEAEGIPEALQVEPGFYGMTWLQSSQMLFDKVVRD